MPKSIEHVVATRVDVKNTEIQIERMYVKERAKTLQKLYGWTFPFNLSLTVDLTFIKQGNLMQEFLYFMNCI